MIAKGGVEKTLGGMKIKTLKRKILLVACVLFPLIGARADTVTLKNGDKLSGEILEESAAGVKLESPMLGVIDIPGSAVASTLLDSQVKEVEEEPEPEPEPSLSEKYWNKLTESIFPKGFSGEILVGYSFTESSDVQNAVDLGIKGKYEEGKHTVTADAFYAYTRKKDEDGEVTKPRDKHGFNVAYEYDIADPFFLRGSNKYLTDYVKEIDLQNDTNALLGWRAFDEDDLSLDLAVGPGVRYLETSSAPGEWDPLVTFLQSSFYQYNESVRFDQKIDYSVDPTDTNSYSLLFEVSTSIRLTSFAEPKIIYRNSYDSVVGQGGIKREQALLVALSLPF